MQKTQKGFAPIKLVITVAISSILAAIAIPWFNDNARIVVNRTCLQELTEYASTIAHYNV